MIQGEDRREGYPAGDLRNPQAGSKSGPTRLSISPESTLYPQAATAPVWSRYHSCNLCLTLKFTFPTKAQLWGGCKKNRATYLLFAKSLFKRSLMRFIDSAWNNNNNQVEPTLICRDGQLSVRLCFLSPHRTLLSRICQALYFMGLMKVVGPLLLEISGGGYFFRRKNVRISFLSLRFGMLLW